MVSPMVARRSFLINSSCANLSSWVRVSTISSRFSVYSLSCLVIDSLCWALSNASMRTSSRIGFVRKSEAPSWRAAMAESISPCPVITITSASLSMALILLRTSMPSIPGILMSVSTSLRPCSSKNFKPCKPLSAVITSYPSLVSESSSTSKIGSSSSIINSFVILIILVRVHGKTDHEYRTDVF